MFILQNLYCTALVSSLQLASSRLCLEVSLAVAESLDSCLARRSVSQTVRRSLSRDKRQQDAVWRRERDDNRAREREGEEQRQIDRRPHVSQKMRNLQRECSQLKIFVSPISLAFILATMISWGKFVKLYFFFFFIQFLHTAILICVFHCRWLLMANTNLTLSSGELAKEKKLQSKCEQTCQLPTWPSFSIGFSFGFRFSFSFNLSTLVSTSTSVSAWIVLRFGFEFGNWQEHEKDREARGLGALELNCKEPRDPSPSLLLLNLLQLGLRAILAIYRQIKRISLSICAQIGHSHKTAVRAGPKVVAHWVELWRINEKDCWSMITQWSHCGKEINAQKRQDKDKLQLQLPYWNTEYINISSPPIKKNYANRKPAKLCSSVTTKSLIHNTEDWYIWLTHFPARNDSFGPTVQRPAAWILISLVSNAADCVALGFIKSKWPKCSGGPGEPHTFGESWGKAGKRTREMPRRWRLPLRFRLLSPAVKWSDDRETGGSGQLAVNPFKWATDESESAVH